MGRLAGIRIMTTKIVAKVMNSASPQKIVCYKKQWLPLITCPHQSRQVYPLLADIRTISAKTAVEEIKPHSFFKYREV